MQEGGAVFLSSGKFTCDMCNITGSTPDSVYGGSPEFFCDSGFYLPVLACPVCKICPAGKYISNESR